MTYNISVLPDSMDFTFPLPKSNLHARYDSLFQSLDRGQSVTFVGLPRSARSAYLKFILEYPQLLKEFCKNPNHHFIVIEDATLTTADLLKLICAKLISIGVISPDTLNLSDYLLTLINLESKLKKLPQDTKISLIFYESQKIINNNPETTALLTRLWNIRRNQPASLIQYCFIDSPILLDAKNHSSWSQIRPALEETLLYFPLFSDTELDYLRSRLESFSGTKIKNHAHISRLSGGHTTLYRVISNLTQTDLEGLTRTRSHPATDSLVSEIWSGIPVLAKLDWSPQFIASHPVLKHLNIDIGLLPPPSHHQEKTTLGNLPQLTAHQKLLFDYLLDHADQVVSRDDIAQLLWGKLWQEKYSDWALDRITARLRHKLTNTPYTLLTLRNRGYKISHI